MGVSVRHMLSTMDSDELTDWMIYAEIEPFGPLQESRNFATLIATICNIVSDKNSIERADVFPELTAERNHWLVEKSKNVDQQALANKIKKAFGSLSKTKGK